jgi:CheY-like chemotaxis protein
MVSILCVEDEEQNIAAMRKALRKQRDLVYSIARTYAEAEKDLQGGPEGVILDMNFPKGAPLGEHEDTEMFLKVVNAIADEPTREHFNKRSNLGNFDNITFPNICKGYPDAGDHFTDFEQLHGCIRLGMRTGRMPFGLYVVEIMEKHDIPGVIVSSERHLIKSLFAYLGEMRESGVRIGYVRTDDFGEKSGPRIWEHAYGALQTEIRKPRRAPPAASQP